MFNKPFSALMLAVFLLSGCAQQSSKVAALLDSSFWTVPFSIEGGEGLSFRLPETLTYSGGGDTDSSSTSWVAEKNGEGSGDVYFSITNFVLSKCPDSVPLGGCGIDEWVPATPEEFSEAQVTDFSARENCESLGEVSVGDATGQAFSCESPAEDIVLLYGTKGAYRITNELRVLTGDADLSEGVFKNFLGTIKVE